MTGLGWGILGPGMIAHAFTRDLLAAGLRPAAVGSRRIESAQEFADTYGIPNAHGSYAELVADDSVDIVYIATPHPFHAGAAKLALEAGKHVLVEKPFTLNEREAREVIALAEERNLLVLEVMWTRFLPHMRRIHEILDAGTLGDIRAVLADHTQLLPSDPTSRLQDPRLGGGALLDLGIYPVSFAIDVLGLPTEVLATSTPTATGVDGQTSIVFRHKGDRLSTLYTALDTRGPNLASVIGTKGRIDIDATWYEATSFTVRDSTGEVLERYESKVDGRGMQYQALEAERVVAAGEIASPLLTPTDSAAIMGVLDTVRTRIGLRYPGE